MSRLSDHQIMAMIQKLEWSAVRFQKEGRPTLERRAERQIQAYRAELAGRSANGQA